MLGCVFVLVLVVVGIVVVVLVVGIVRYGWCCSCAPVGCVV